MRRLGQRSQIGGLALLVTAGMTFVGLVACGSSDGGATGEHEAGTTVPASQQHPKWPPGQKACPDGTPEYHTHPAKISGNNAAGTTTSILLPVNVWTAGDCHQVTAVEAGAAGWHASAGILVITRIRGSHAAGREYVVIPDSGAVKITDAPLGPKVVTSAQTGELQFKGKRGVTGTLNLADDTATLSTGAVIQPTDRPFSGAG
jgi:hypothetical protein